MADSSQTRVEQHGLEPSPEALAKRVEVVAHSEFVRGATLWRSGRVTIMLVGLYTIGGLLPFLPGAGAVTSIPAEVTVAFYTGMVFWAVVSWMVVARWGIESRQYQPITWLEPAYWNTGSCLLVLFEGSAQSIAWFNVGVFVVLMSTAWKRHHIYRAYLLAGVAAVVLTFAWWGQVADAAFSIALGTTLVMMQILSTIGAKRVDRERARSELLSEASAAMQARYERERIGRELHDGLGAELTALLWRASAIEGSEEVITSVQRSMATLRAVVAEASDTPMPADKLIRELNRTVGDLSEIVRIDFDDELPDTPIDASRAATCIRCAQELVRNALTHAGADTVDVHLSFEPLKLTVRDDGVWQENPHGYGLDSISARARETGGSLHVETSSHGTEVRVLLSQSADERPSTL